MVNRLHWYQCPGKNLTKIVRFLDPELFESLSREPGFDEVEKFVRAINPSAGDSDISNAFRYRTMLYGRRQRLAFELYKFGGSIEEIKNNLGLHVCECRRCDRRYSRIIDRRLEDELLKLKKRSPELARTLKPKQIGEIRERIEKRYLNLTSLF